MDDVPYKTERVVGRDCVSGYPVEIYLWVCNTCGCYVANEHVHDIVCVGGKS